MVYIILADSIVVLHFLFIIFVITGGLLALKWRKIIWLHLPAAVWGALIEFTGWICPLTLMENDLRIKGNNLGYSGGFIQHYLIPVIYPAGLTRQIQFILGGFVVFLNLLVYWSIIRKWLGENKKAVR